MSHRFIIAGGGTGGHIFPALSIAEAILSMRPDASFQFIGAKGKMEMEKVPQAGFPIEGLDIVGFNRTHLLKNILLPIKLIRSFLQVRSIFRRFRPSAVIGVGGYSSYPVLRYAQSRQIPTFIHEANSYAGKSNQWLAKRATRIFTGMPSMERFFPTDKMLFTGNPVRSNIRHFNSDRSAGLAAFGLTSDKPTLLAIGGSLGARSINRALQSGWKRLVDAGWQLIWQTGQSGSSMPALDDSARGRVCRLPFIQEMDKAYACADIVVARSGAMSIAELQVLGKPAILVPYPFSAEDHQTENAMLLVRAHAAEMVRDETAEQELIDRILELSGDPVRCRQMSEQIAQMGIADADHRIATAILSTLETKTDR